MSYFINPDGTIQFVEDRYDSAGNITSCRPLTHHEMTGDDKYDNRNKRKERNIYGNLPIGRNKRKSKRVSYYSEEKIKFRDEVFTVSRQEHINAFFDYLTTNGIHMTMTDFDIIHDQLTGIRRIWFDNAFRKYRYNRSNGN